MKESDHEEIYNRICGFVADLMDEFHQRRGEKDLTKVNVAITTNMIRAALKGFLIKKKYAGGYPGITEAEEDPQALFDCTKDVLQILNSALDLADPENTYRIEILRKEGK